MIHHFLLNFWDILGPLDPIKRLWSTDYYDYNVQVRGLPIFCKWKTNSELRV
jgi:hypothetical protein